MTDVVRYLALRLVAVALASWGLAACASAEPGKMTAETSPPQAVDQADDNAVVLRELQPRLVVTVEIDGETASLVDATISMVRRVVPRRQGIELVTLRSLSRGRTVGEVRLPDERLNVRHGGGLVVRERRVLTAAVPVTRAVDTVEVTIPGVAESSRLDVQGIVEEFCKEHSQTELCRPTAE